MYAELKELAGQRSSEKRLHLLRKIADMFFDGVDRHTESETSLFNEVMETIVDQVSRDAKIDIATDLAILPGFPLPVVRKLANDPDIEIARPVIRGASGLTDFDLIEIARKASDEHLDAIAARPQLSEGITDVLIDRGSRHVMHTISANHGAQFSQWGMDVLVNRASDDGQLQNALVERSDLTQKAVNALAAIVSEALAIKLIERGYRVQGNIPDELVKQASRRFALTVRERDQKMLAAERIISEFGSGRLPFEDALLQIVACEQMLAIAAMLDYRSGIDRQMLMSILKGGVTQTVMILLRGLDLKWNTASAILALRSKQLQPDQPCDARREAFEAIDIAVAKRTIRFLVVRARTTAGSSMLERGEMATAM